LSEIWKKTRFGQDPQDKEDRELEGLEVRDPDMDDPWRPTRNSHFRAKERIRSGLALNQLRRGRGGRAARGEGTLHWPQRKKPFWSLALPAICGLNSNKNRSLAPRGWRNKDSAGVTLR